MTEKQIQQKYFEIQILEQQIKQIQQQLSVLQQQILGLYNVQESLENIKNLKVGQAILTPLGSGIFIDTDLKNNQKILVNIGANVMVKKEIPEVKATIEKQINQIKDAVIEIEENLQKVTQKSEELQQELLTLVEKNK